jgi:hypothetical protein
MKPSANGMLNSWRKRRRRPKRLIYKYSGKAEEV